jgi:hypothetical protein
VIFASNHRKTPLSIRRTAVSNKCWIPAGDYQLEVVATTKLEHAGTAHVELALNKWNPNFVPFAYLGTFLVQPACHPARVAIWLRIVLEEIRNRLTGQTPDMVPFTLMSLMTGRPCLTISDCGAAAAWP